MRFLYSLLGYLMTPFILFYLRERSKGNRDYRWFWGERFGLGLKYEVKKPVIWLHAVSVGETRAMQKMYVLLQTKFPNHQILITTMTPTGRETAKLLYKSAIVHYIPYDMPHAVKRFYKVFKPEIGIIMETEIWPNLLHYANKYGIKTYLVNARLSPKSYKSYKRVSFILGKFINYFDAILCQDKNTESRFKDLGFAGSTAVLGNTKFDLVLTNIDEAFIAKARNNNLTRKIIIFASTREKEESLILKNLPADATFLVVIVPRHPERFSLIEKLIQENGIKYQKRSSNEEIASDTQILLGDSMGEMFMYYKMADVAIIGGSFNNGGGQNIIEPIYISKPVVFGPSMYNFTKVSSDALDDGCALQVKNMKQCFDTVKDLLNNQSTHDQMVKNCELFVAKHKGASEKIINFIEQDANVSRETIR